MADTEWKGCGRTNATTGSCVEIKTDVIRYVNKVDSNSGWTAVKHGNEPEFLQLYKYCKVMLLGTKEGRTYFKVLEGREKGKTVHMSEANAKEYLGKLAPKREPIVMTVTYGKYDPRWKSEARGGQILRQQLAKATINGMTIHATMNSVWPEDRNYNNYFPLPPGTYTILLPNWPHDAAMTSFYQRYEPTLMHHQVWFPIKFGDNSRHVHVGNVSEGCVTVIDLDKWSAVEEALISHRGPDGESVGTLIVKGKPDRVR